MSAYSDRVLADSAVAYWRLDEASGNFVDEVSGRVGTPSGGVTYGHLGAISDQNPAALFDGVDGYVEMATPGELQPTTALTFEAWVNLNDIAQTINYIGGSGDTGNVGYALWTVGATGRVSFNVGNGTTNGRAITTTALQNGTWYHLLGTFDNENVRLYVNGVLEDTEPLTGPIDYTDITTARVGQLNAINANRYFDGYLDEVAIYPGVLTGSQVEVHYALHAARPSRSSYAAWQAAVI